MYRGKYRSIEVTVGPAYWPAFASAAGLLLVQTMFSPYLAFRGAVPSLVTIPVVLYCLRVGARRGARLALPIGLLEDIFAGTGGAWTLSYTLLAMGCGSITGRFFADGVVVPSLFVGLAVIVRSALFWVIMAAEGYPRGYGNVHLHAALESGALTAVYAFVYLLFRSRYGGEPTRIERYT